MRKTWEKKQIRWKELWEMKEVRRNYFLAQISMREDKKLPDSDKFPIIIEVNYIFYEIDKRIKRIENGED